MVTVHCTEALRAIDSAAMAGTKFLADSANWILPIGFCQAETFPATRVSFLPCLDPAPVLQTTAA